MKNEKHSYNNTNGKQNFFCPSYILFKHIKNNNSNTNDKAYMWSVPRKAIGTSKLTKKNMDTKCMHHTFIDDYALVSSYTYKR